jgi:hypothetical protein
MPDKVRIHDLGDDDFFFDEKEAEERIRKALPAVVEAINWKAGRKVVELFFVNGQIGGIRKLDHMGGDNA